MHRLALFVAILVLAMLLGACKTSLTPNTTPASKSDATAGQLADLGKNVYSTSCARCHGDQGQGGRAPAVIGASANLSKYSTAKGLLDKIVTTMPMNAPNSLPAAQYQQVLYFILVQSKLVQPDAAVNDSALASLQLK